MNEKARYASIQGRWRRLVRAVAVAVVGLVEWSAGLLPTAATSMADAAPVATRPATTVAARLGQAIWSYDWQISPTKALAGQRPWVTTGLWAQLRSSPGAPAEQAVRVRDHELDRVTSISTVVADTSAEGIGVAVSALIAVTKHGKPAGAGRDDAEMLVIRTSAGWRVSEIDQ